MFPSFGVLAASVLLAATLPAAHQAGGDVANKIKATEQALLHASARHDGKTFRQLVAPDSIAVYPDRGLVTASENAQRIESMTNCTFNEPTMEHATVTQFDDRTAVITYKSVYESICNGQRRTGTIWFGTLYLHRNGVWTPVFHQASPVEAAKMK